VAVCGPLPTEAVESWECFSYVHDVMSIMIQWVSGGGPRVTDLEAMQKRVSVYRVCGCLPSIERQFRIYYDCNLKVSNNYTNIKVCYISNLLSLHLASDDVFELYCT